MTRELSHGRLSRVLLNALLASDLSTDELREFAFDKTSARRVNDAVLAALKAALGPPLSGGSSKNVSRARDISDVLRKLAKALESRFPEINVEHRKNSKGRKSESDFVPIDEFIESSPRAAAEVLRRLAWSSFSGTPESSEISILTDNLAPNAAWTILDYHFPEGKILRDLNTFSPGELLAVAFVLLSQRQFATLVNELVSAADLTSKDPYLDEIAKHRK